MINFRKTYNSKKAGLLLASLAGMLVTAGSVYALLPDVYSNNFDDFGGSDWQRSGSVYDEKFYCKGGNCLKLSSGGGNGSVTAQFNVLPDATYRVRAFGAVHNAAGVSRTATVEIRMDDGVDSRRVQCGDPGKSDINVGCVGGGDPNGVFKEMKVEKKALSRTMTVVINGWAGDCNERGCSEAYIDEFYLDKIADPPESGDNPQPANTPTPTPTTAPAPTNTPTPTQGQTQPTPTPTSVPGVTATPTPTSVPAVTATPTPGSGTGGNTNLGCPSGMTGVISGSTIICLQQTQTATGGSATANATGGSVNLTLQGGSTKQTNNNVTAVKAPVAEKKAVVNQSNVNSLPKTGLPMAAWAMSGLLPVGLGFKRFGKNLSNNRNVAAFLWQERAYLKEN
jgi:hypothetical protein